MSNIHFLFDENTPPLLRLALLRKWPEIVAWRVDLPGAPKRCASDCELLAWCAARHFLLVTRRHASPPVGWQEPLPDGQPAPGLFLLDEKTTIHEAIEALALFWLTAKAEIFTNSTIYL
jgi:hypothetical protein